MIFFFVTGVTIGFEEETVQILENIRMKTLCVNVSLGQLLRTTTVNVSYQDQTAISEYTNRFYCLDSYYFLTNFTKLRNTNNFDRWRGL